MSFIAPMADQLIATPRRRYLFPLEKSFFYITKPCTMMPYDEVDEIEFQRQGGQLSLSAAKTFDIKVIPRLESHTFV